MSTYDLFEIAVVALIVGLSAWSAVIRPLLRRRQRAEADGCGQKSAACGGCSGCGDSKTTTEQPIRFQR